METERINSLARELLKHGMANSSSDAYRQAEMMVSKNAENKDEGHQNTILGEFGLRLNSVQREVNTIQNDIANLKKNFEQFGSEISSVKSKLNSIIFRIENHSKEKDAAVKEKKEIQQAQHKDISIEKIFYFGNKK